MTTVTYAGPSDEELAGITEMVKGRRCGVEIGTWSGGSARAILDGMHPEGTLLCVDDFRGHVREAHMLAHFSEAQTEGGREKVKAAWRERLGPHLPRATLMETSSDAAAGLVKRTRGRVFDLLWIDGGHEYDDIRADLNAWVELVVEGGMVCGHDFASYFPGVVKAVLEDFRDRVRVGPGSLWRVQL